MTLRQLRLNLLIGVVGALVCAGNCAAGLVAYSNLGTPIAGAVLGVIPTVFYGERELIRAQRFTPTTSGRLSRLELLMDFATQRYVGRPRNIDQLTLRLVTEENGLPSNTELWSQLFVDQSFRSTGFPDASSISSFDVDAGLTLQEGMHYWLTATAISIGDTPYVWHYTSADVEPRGRYFVRGNEPDALGRWLVTPGVPNGELGLRVTVIPEPAAAALMLAASATLLAVRRRILCI